MATHPTANIVKKEIFIECRPETLFAFLTEPEKMAQWMGRHVLLEPAVGGRFRIDFNGSDVVLGHYVEVIPYEKVVVTWGWQGMTQLPPGSSVVEFRLRPQDNGTMLELTHSGLPDAKLPTHTAGWNYYTIRLQTVISGLDPGPDTFAPATNSSNPQ